MQKSVVVSAPVYNFKNCPDTGISPGIWKRSSIVKANLTNKSKLTIPMDQFPFRLFLEKIFEKLVFNLKMDFLEENILLNSNFTLAKWHFWESTSLNSCWYLSNCDFNCGCLVYMLYLCCSGSKCLIKLQQQFPTHKNCLYML